MATIAENLQTIKDSTDAIKQAIIDKGGTVEGDISTWAESIGNIISGGGTELGFLIKNDLIGNKLEGATLQFLEQITTETVLYQYTLFNATRVLIINSCFELNYLMSTTSTVSTLKLYNANSQGLTTSLLVYTDGTVSLSAHTGSYLSSYETIPIIIVVVNGGTYDIDYFYIHCSMYTCFLKNTNISLSSGITKKVQDINYNDELLVWNFDEGKFDKAKPLWIKKEEVALSYYKVTLENGTILNLVGSNGKCHRLFNYDDQLFESATDLVGKNVHTLTGVTKVVSVENIEETCEYYNLITDYHMNCFANGVLTSCRYNNLYPIQDMVFDKTQVKLEPRYKIHAEKFQPNPEILPKYIKGMRLDENTSIPIEEMKSYIQNLERLRKRIDDFEENQEMVESVEEASVGWIDPEGNVYGYRLYMPGQMNHITLADKICNKLGYREQELGGYSKTLEDLGWCKFTDEFLLTTSDLTDRQEHKLAKFMSTNEKVKKRGTIKLGNIFSESTTINHIKNMSKEDLTTKMRGGRKV